MKSIDVFCHLMPPEYAKICMAEAPNRSHMFVRALKVPSMSNMESRNEVLKEFPGYKQIPNIVSPPVETFAGPDKSPRLAAIGNDEIKKSSRLTRNSTKASSLESRSITCRHRLKKSSVSKIWVQRAFRFTLI